MEHKEVEVVDKAEPCMVVEEVDKLACMVEAVVVHTEHKVVEVVGRAASCKVVVEEDTRVDRSKVVVIGHSKLPNMSVHTMKHMGMDSLVVVLLVVVLEEVECLVLIHMMLSDEIVLALVLVLFLL